MKQSQQHFLKTSKRSRTIKHQSVLQEEGRQNEGYIKHRRPEKNPPAGICWTFTSFHLALYRLIVLTLVVFLFGCLLALHFSCLFFLGVCFCFQCSRTPPSLTVWMLPCTVHFSALQFCSTESLPADWCIKNAPLQSVEHSRQDPRGSALLYDGLYHSCSI